MLQRHDTQLERSLELHPPTTMTTSRAHRHSTVELLQVRCELVKLPVSTNWCAQALVAFVLSLTDHE